MTSVFSFRPEFFNQNGDQGNIEVLEYAAGTRFTVSEQPQADLLVIGDASRAAIREFESELLALVPEVERRFASGLPTVVVGNSYEFFASKSKLLPNLESGKRISAFVEVDFEGQKVYGYRNSTVTDGELLISGGFVGTLLFGPILAKNEGLLLRIAEELGLKVTIPEDYQKLALEARKNVTFG